MPLDVHVGVVGDVEDTTLMIRPLDAVK